MIDWYAIKTLPGLMFLALMALLITQFYNEPVEYQESKGSYDPGEIILIDKKVVDFSDSLINDTLYVGKIYKSQLPVVFRELNAGVCEDKLCLPIDLYLFWSFSGNYLGFRPIKPFTRNRHDPFLERDYLKLHRLLGDPQSLLANYSLGDLTVEDPDKSSVDGISAATLKDIQGYIIEGAAYTSHTLWHMAYGPMRDSVNLIASEYVDENIMKKYFGSSNRQDIIWALNQFKENAQTFSELIPQVHSVMTGNDPIISQIAIERVINSDLGNQAIQSVLLEVYPEVAYNAKREMIDYFRRIDGWYFSSVLKIINIMSLENNGLNEVLFGLLKEKSSVDSLTRENIHQLMDREDKNQKQLSIRYLEEMGIQEAIY